MNAGFEEHEKALTAFSRKTEQLRETNTASMYEKGINRWDANKKKKKGGGGDKKSSKVAARHQMGLFCCARSCMVETRWWRTPEQTSPLFSHRG